MTRIELLYRSINWMAFYQLHKEIYILLCCYSYFLNRLCIVQFLPVSMIVVVFIIWLSFFYYSVIFIWPWLMIVRIFMISVSYKTLVLRISISVWHFMFLMSETAWQNICVATLYFQYAVTIYQAPLYWVQKVNTTRSPKLQYFIF